MKKNQPSNNESANRQPRTDLDIKFLAAVQEFMAKRGMSSDRAMSLALGRSENFLNRVRNGYQSATPEAWSALLAQYPEAQNITTTNVMSQGGQAIGVNHGTATQNHGTAPSTEAPSELATAQALIEQLKSQLADKERLIASLEGTIASKEEIISLLRGGYNRPN